MKTLKLITAMLCITFIGCINAQKNNATKVIPENWTAQDCEVDYTDNIIGLTPQNEPGILWLNNVDLKNGVIELDIKGKDLRGESFVGIAFHGMDNNTYDCIYFRPFNFKSPERKTHSVQYTSAPDKSWSVLRKNFPGKYENTVDPVPYPNDWFHAKIVIEFPNVKVYVNGASNPSLEIEQISNRKTGKFGLWAGSPDSYFKNIQVTSK